VGVTDQDGYRLVSGFGTTPQEVGKESSEDKYTKGIFTETIMRRGEHASYAGVGSKRGQDLSQIYKDMVTHGFDDSRRSERKIL